MTQYQQALSLKPDYAVAHNNLGNVLQEQGNADEAVVHHRHALAINPNFVEAHNNLGNAFKEQGRLDEALAQYQTTGAEARLRRGCCAPRRSQASAPVPADTGPTPRPICLAP